MGWEILILAIALILLFIGVEARLRFAIEGIKKAILEPINKICEKIDNTLEQNKK